MQSSFLVEISVGFPNLASEMKRLLDDMPLWSPKHFGVLPQDPLLDIKETPDAFEFVVDAPGVRKEVVKIRSSYVLTDACNTICCTNNVGRNAIKYLEYHYGEKML